MHWIALRWLPPEATDMPMPPMPSDEALGWWALQFTPRVAWVDEALLLEVSACERLWGGRLGLMRQIASLNPAPVRVQQAQGATCLIALARLRMFARGEQPPPDVPSNLPLDTLSAARDHLDVLAHLGCRTWGDVAALPRGGLTRRFGKELRTALDAAYGLRPESHRWLTLPDVFEQKLELPALAEGAPELMWSANRLLSALQIWLRVRQRGARALELQWTLDLKRLNGVNLPPHQHITVRTAEATQDMAHLRRLISEKLALTTLAAPASWLRLRSLETDPWTGASASFLPEDNRKGDRLHEMVERLSARLGPQQVLVPVAQADHRPERTQAWQPALQSKGRVKTDKPVAASPSQPDAIYPAWLLPEPLRLDMDGERPCYRGPLRRLIGPQRIEAGWWGGVVDGGRPAVRDYYVAESPEAGLVWIFRERPATSFASDEVRWYLQGLYA
ncbi:DNA polymerase Y family protein [Variovorax sp. J22R24]|uniref:Y-family DNA polymerase n=1 Tax=Variovorax gracilis TaxID=3053502 RepID=UPI002574FB50|nr:DNA polymerase Y family protein [Variovorax sp. J22R24]MDM0104022.1 DNA polymerase Y family protein [Variovorax sp. J22R24]